MSYVRFTSEFHLRACRPIDCDAIKEAHAKVLPIQYDEDFFKRICWTKGSYFAVCALSTSEPQSLAGFLSARTMPPKCFCFNDRQALQQVGVTLQPQDQVLYLLTIGVMSEYRRQGLAGRMLRFAVEVRTTVHAPTNHEAVPTADPILNPRQPRAYAVVHSLASVHP